jgi:hypothetical protein
VRVGYLVGVACAGLWDAAGWIYQSASVVVWVS